MTETTEHHGELVEYRGADNLLAQIRPHWSEKRLIERTRKLLAVDPSSACQRVFNAAIHDLREKIVLAGIDIAAKMASDHKLPAIKDAENVMDHYTVTHVINLSYRMGLLSRPEWRRIQRCYDIRRDLEHEDDEYEAEIEDVVYIFKTSIEVVLARDPIHLLRVEDIKDLVESDEATRVSPEFVEEFEDAPDTRQLEILKYLLSRALDQDAVQIVQTNAVEVLKSLSPHIRPQIRLEITEHFQKQIGQRSLTDRGAKVATACGIMHLVTGRIRRGFFKRQLKRFEEIGPQWQATDKHRDLLETFSEFGGLKSVPKELLSQFVEWLLKCYLGEKGNRGMYGHNRPVFYSNSGSHRAASLLIEARETALTLVEAEGAKRETKQIREYKPIDKRYQTLIDQMTD